MVSAKEMFANTDWLHHLQAIASECTELGSSIDMVIVGAYGKTSDEEKAVAMAVAMRKSGMVGNLSLVANRDNVLMRARLAKGTANVLGAHDVKVAAGRTDGVEARVSDSEFGSCPYLSMESELWGLQEHGEQASHAHACCWRALSSCLTR